MAACSFSAVATPGDDGRVLLQVTPAQDFRPSDGREMDVPAWRINAAIASKVISRFNPAQPLVIDYEHQTLHKETNGQPAPAAGWMHGFRWIDGKGLFAVVALTQRAREQIASGEYAYFSPVFLYDQTSGEVLQITMGALTNNPAIHGMQALSVMQAAASAQFSATNPNPEDPMNPLLKALLAALGLPETTTEQAALSAVTSHTAVANAARAALQLKADDDAPAVQAACSALRTQAATPATPDPAQFVPIGVVNELRTSLAVLTARQAAQDVEAVIAPALEKGLLLPGEQETWARELGKTNLAALTAFLKTAQPIAALSSTQTNGKPPAGQANGGHGLSAEDLAVCTAMGLAPEQFAAAQK